MLERVLSSKEITVLEKALETASLRHKVIANNIANVNTPRFKKSEVEFEAKLQEALGIKKRDKLSLACTHPRHIGEKPLTLADVKPEVHTINSTTFRNDENNVDIDEEMANMAQNHLAYNAVAQQLSHHLQTLKTVASERGR